MASSVPTDSSSTSLSSSDTLNPSPVPTITSKPSSQLVPEPPLSGIIGQTFAPFDHQKAVVKPFSEESARDAVFRQELSAMLLDVMLETHAWAAARPKFESEIAVAKFEKKISEVMEVEKEQEQTRERLNEFVCSLKTALSALTGLERL